MQEDGMKIVDRNDIFDRKITEIVGGTIGHASSDPAAGKAHRKTRGVVVPPIFALNGR